MVFNPVSNVNFQRGITLVEIMVVVFIIVLFSTIVIADFPRIENNFAISRSAYDLAQDLRKAQDLGLSGSSTLGNAGPITTIKGYGIYVSTSQPTQYLIYADMVSGDTNQGNHMYDPGSSTVCSAETVTQPRADCVLSTVSFLQENPNVYVVGFYTTGQNPITATSMSVNFMPPNPVINLTDGSGVSYPEIGIILGLKTDPTTQRVVWVNTSGLVSVQ